MLVMFLLNMSVSHAFDFRDEDPTADMYRLKMQEAQPQNPIEKEKQEQEKKEELKIKNIEVVGNKLINNTAILQAMRMQMGDVYSRDLVQQDLKKIYSMGYFSDKIKAIPIRNIDNTITLKIMVEENKPITDFTVEGNDIVKTGEILEILNPLIGEPQNMVLLNQAVEDVQELYDRKGYILARVVAVQDDPDGVVNMVIDEGIINSIIIEGNHKTKDFVVKRNILSKPDTVYNENSIKQDLMRLYGTQIFKDVKREIKRSEENPDKYDVVIQLEEQRTGTISLGGGVDTTTGLFLSGGFGDNNFRGLGQRVNLNLMGGTGVIMSDSSVLNRANWQAELSFFEPNLKGTDNSLLTKLFFRDFASYQIPLAIEQRFGAEITLGRKLKTYDNLTASVGLGLENINVKEGNYNSIQNLYKAHNIPISERAKQLNGGLFATITPSLIYDTRDNLINPRNGVLAVGRIEQAFGVNDLSLTHAKLTGSIKKYFPVGKKSSFSLTARAGGKLYGNNMPEVMAFRLGGPYNVRGYKLSSVGTGDGFMMASAEYLVPIPFLDRIEKMKFLNNVRIAFFCDAGKVVNQYTTDKIYDRPGYGIAAGAGLRVFIPGVGPLSIDYGVPLTRPGSENSKSGTFSFGAGDYY